MRRIILIAALMPALAASAVFKCVGKNGETTFSDVPCAGQPAKQVDVKIDRSRQELRPRQKSAEVNRIEREFDAIRRSVRSTSGGSRGIGASEVGGHCREFSDTEVRTMIIKNQVVAGMRGADALKSWGTPDSVNGAQHAYWWNNSWSIFYVRGGCVSSVDGEYRGSKFVR